MANESCQCLLWNANDSVVKLIVCIKSFVSFDTDLVIKIC